MDTLKEICTLHTKAQIESLYRAWDTRADIPRKGYRTIVQLPARAVVSVTYSEHKSDTGARLYELIMTPWGTTPSWLRMA